MRVSPWIISSLLISLDEILTCAPVPEGRDKSCYTPKFNFCQSPDYFFCAFTSRCERDGYYNPYKFDDSYKGVLKEQYRELETKDNSKEEKTNLEKEETESEKSVGNKSFDFKGKNPVTALKALLANSQSRKEWLQEQLCITPCFPTAKTSRYDQDHHWCYTSGYLGQWKYC